MFGVREIKRGSFTVEAAFLMPLVMVCILFLIYIGFYWYNCAVCTGACYNASRLLAAEDSSFSLAQEQQLLTERTMALQNLRLVQTTAGSRITVTASAQMRVPLLGRTLTVYAQQSAYQLDPRTFIMRCRFLQRMLE